MILPAERLLAVAADMRGCDSLRLVGEQAKKGAHGETWFSPCSKEVLLSDERAPAS
jgi:hypothetical protein